MFINRLRNSISRNSVTADLVVENKNLDSASTEEADDEASTNGDQTSQMQREKSFSMLEDSKATAIKTQNELDGKRESEEKNTTERIGTKCEKIVPSYKTKNSLKSVLIQSTKQNVINVNEKYTRTRRYDAAGKYRIGPSFITKSRLAYMDEHKPAKLSVVPDLNSKSLEFGLLTYLWTFTDQHDKQVIDLSFLQSLVDSGVNINCRDEHGQTILHAIVRDWHPDVALFAIRNNADVNVQDKMGRSPLHLAAALNSVESARILLLNGAIVDVMTTNENQTPMHYAAKFNSLDTMKLLIKYQGSITQRDGKEKTVLFLSAEQGSVDTAQFLLDIGAPAGVYDNEGYSAITHLMEKMPYVAYRALRQFVVTNRSLKRSEMYLSYLESNTKGKSATVTKGPLEIITTYDDTDLIMHPVIQKAIEVKWNLFGKMDTIRKFFITILYLICWLVLAYTFPDDGNFYKPWRDDAWKIVFEVLIVLFSAYFFYMEFSIKKDTIKYHRAWVEWRQHLVRSNYVNCHPTWPGDRENLESEAERIRAVPSLAGKQKFWFFYELITLVILLAIIITRVLDMTINDTRNMLLLHKCIFGIGMIVGFVRLLKISIRFRYFSVFLKVTGLAFGSFMQVAFLYLQLFIPFVAAFWLIYGSDNGKQKISRLSNTTKGSVAGGFRGRMLTTLEDLMYHVFEGSFNQQGIFKYVIIEKITGQIFISLYHILVTFILLSIFVALITSKFTTHYNRCVAEASLLQASVILQLEKNLSKKDKLKLANYYKRFCNPLVITSPKYKEEMHHRNTFSSLRLAERRLTGIQNVAREVEDKCQKNDRRSQNVIMENIFGSSYELASKQEVFSKTLKTGMKDILQKQQYMNRYLPKLLKPTTGESQ